MTSHRRVRGKTKWQRLLGATANPNDNKSTGRWWMCANTVCGHKRKFWNEKSEHCKRNWSQLEMGDDSVIKEYLANIGKRGGKSGRGTKKRRSREHYQRMAKLSHAKRKANRSGQPAPLPEG